MALQPTELSRLVSSNMILFESKNVSCFKVYFDKSICMSILLRFCQKYSHTPIDFISKMLSPRIELSESGMVEYQCCCVFWQNALKIAKKSSFFFHFFIFANFGII